MKVKILGSGTSTGVPEIGCTCPVCTSSDPRDQRLRTSAMICTDDARILMDCGPDFREQMLMPYCLVDRIYPGVPRIYLQDAEPGKAFYINRTEILPFRVMHGRLPILGFRIGKRLGYITDMLTMPDESYECLQELDLLIMNALRTKPHPTHQSIGEALLTAKRIGAKETYLVHMSHHAGLHADIERTLPQHIHFAYDGVEIEI